MSNKIEHKNPKPFVTKGSDGNTYYCVKYDIYAVDSNQNGYKELKKLPGNSYTLEDGRPLQYHGDKFVINGTNIILNLNQ